MKGNPLLISVQVALEKGGQEEAIGFIDKVHEFISSGKYGEVLDNWEPESVRILIGYHMAKGTFICEQDADGEIEGVLMWYNCDNDDTWDMVHNWQMDKPNGDSVFMAFLYAKNNAAFKKVTLGIIAKEPNVLWKKLIGLRMKSGVATKMNYTTKLFSKILSAKS